MAEAIDFVAASAPSTLSVIQPLEGAQFKNREIYAGGPSRPILLLCLSSSPKHSFRGFARGIFWRYLAIVSLRGTIARFLCSAKSFGVPRLELAASDGSVLLTMHASKNSPDTVWRILATVSKEFTFDHDKRLTSNKL